MTNTSRCGLFLLFVGLPSALTAQRGMGSRGGMGGMGRGGSRGGRGDRSGEARAPQIPSSQDILKGSPLRLLIEKSKDLSLADSQRTQLVKQAAALDDRIAPLLVALDSSHAAHPAPPSDSARAVGDRASALDGFRGVWQTLTAIRVVEDSASNAAVSSFADHQRAKAYKLLAERRDAMDKKERPPRRPP